MSDRPQPKRIASDPELSAIHQALTADLEPDGCADVDPAVPDAGVPGLTNMLTNDMFASEVQRYVDALLEAGVSPTPATRDRLHDAAGRALRETRRQHDPLPVLLADRRREQQKHAAAVAAALNVSVQQVLDWESGKVNLRCADVNTVGAWIAELGLSEVAALRAYRKALVLTVPASARQAARSSRRELPAADQALVIKLGNVLGLEVNQIDPPE